MSHYNVLDVIKDELKGTAQKLSKEEQTKRISICESCEKFKKLSRQCGICGCFIDMKTKYTLSSCDLEKW